MNNTAVEWGLWIFLVRHLYHYPFCGIRSEQISGGCKTSYVRVTQKELPLSLSQRQASLMLLAGKMMGQQSRLVGSLHFHSPLYWLMNVPSQRSISRAYPYGCLRSARYMHRGPNKLSFKAYHVCCPLKFSKVEEILKENRAGIMARF